MTEWIYAPNYRRGDAEKMTVKVEQVYEDGHGNYVGVLKAADGRRYTHSVRDGSVEDQEKCKAFGVRDLTEIQGRSLEVFVSEHEIVAARLCDEEQEYYVSY